MAAKFQKSKVNMEMINYNQKIAS